MLPITGWLSAHLGRRNYFLMSIAVFTLASAACGMATSLPQMILFRVIQGLSGGGLQPSSQGILMDSFPPEKQGTAMTLFGLAAIIAPVVGPTLGGWLCVDYNWRWIFLINVPFGLLTAFVCWRALHRQETATRAIPVDGIGLAMLVVWVGALQIMLDTGKDEGWFDSTQIIVLSLVSLIGFVAFMIWQYYEEHPIVDLSFFRNRNFTVGVFLTCVGYAVFFANVVILPLWLQTQLGN